MGFLNSTVGYLLRWTEEFGKVSFTFNLDMANNE